MNNIETVKECLKHIWFIDSEGYNEVKEFDKLIDLKPTELDILYKKLQIIKRIGILNIKELEKFRNVGLIFNFDIIESTEELKNLISLNINKLIELEQRKLKYISKIPEVL